MHSAPTAWLKIVARDFFMDTAMDTERSLSKPAARLELLHRSIFRFGRSVGSVIAATLRGFLEIHG
jgi:hypothetical protein